VPSFIEFSVGTPSNQLVGNSEERPPSLKAEKRRTEPSAAPEAIR
jgi:hypothetical protein